MGWESLKNGELLGAAEIEFEVLLTVDQNISHQQNMTERSIAIVILIVPDNTVTTLLPLIPELLTLLPTVKPGNIYYIGIPRI